MSIEAVSEFKFQSRAEAPGLVRRQDRSEPSFFFGVLKRLAEKSWEEIFFFSVEIGVSFHY